YIQWVSQNTSNGPANWILQSQVSVDANTFTSKKYDISLRPRSLNVVQWSPESWIVNNTYSSPDIRHLIQNIIDQPGWINGNNIALIMSGNGLREAWSYDGDPMKTAQLIITFETECNDTGVLYVDKNATGNQDGSSWATAYRSLESALDRSLHCSSIDQIWIANGEYAPYQEVPRTFGYNIPAGVSIYGGFQGFETSVAQRIYGSFPTILSGDIGVSGNLTDNLFHVVSILPGTGNTLLDGLTIEKGMANGSLSSQQTGAGIYNEGKLYCRQVILRNNSYPSLYNAMGSELWTDSFLEIRQ
ncbi:MAG TPA: hypothetical protein VMZ69_06625, partial [Saprospiraceae bacterium]|nr:hypothetical protein [Saprospiraceae bacterium]